MVDEFEQAGMSPDGEQRFTVLQLDLHAGEVQLAPCPQDLLAEAPTAGSDCADSQHCACCPDGSCALGWLTPALLCHMPPHRSGCAAAGAGPSAQGPVDLPTPDMRTLGDLARALSNVGMWQKERVARQVLARGFLDRLLEIFHVSNPLQRPAGRWRAQGISAQTRGGRRSMRPAAILPSLQGC